MYLFRFPTYFFLAKQNLSLIPDLPLRIMPCLKATSTATSPNGDEGATQLSGLKAPRALEATQRLVAKSRHFFVRFFSNCEENNWSVQLLFCPHNFGRFRLFGPFRLLIIH